jgi:hypothetical protein
MGDLSGTGDRERVSWRRPRTGSGGVSNATGALPVPWQQRLEVGDLVLGDAREHVCKPGPRINVVELAALDEREHDRRTLTTAIGAGEEPRLPLMYTFA